MPYSPTGAQPLGFVPLQAFGVYPWQAYVQPGHGHWSMPGMHKGATEPSSGGAGFYFSVFVVPKCTGGL